MRSAENSRLLWKVIVLVLDLAVMSDLLDWLDCLELRSCVISLYEESLIRA